MPIITIHHFKGLVLAVCINVIFLACTPGDRKSQAETWYNETKATLFKQSDAKADSTMTQYNADSTVQTVSPYANGHMLLKRVFIHRRLRTEVYYSLDSRFELRREVCENGQASFEGIFVDEKPYGLSSWYYCDGKKREEGMYCNQEKIGVWRKWDPAGKLTEEVDHQHLDKVDDFPKIKK